MPEIHPENHPNDPFFPRDEHNAKRRPLSDAVAEYKANKQIDFSVPPEVMKPLMGATFNIDGDPIDRAKFDAMVQEGLKDLATYKAENMIPTQQTVRITNEPIPHDDRYPDEKDTRTPDEVLRDDFVAHVYSQVMQRRANLEEPEVPDQLPLFINFEGGEGSGKSTLAQELYRQLIKWRVPAILTREPGGSDTGVHIRKILMDPTTAPKSRRAELLLFLADRAEHVDTVIKPHLEQGYVVICDRFHASTLAYQGAGPKEQVDGHPDQIPPSLIEGFSWWAADNVTPDVTFLLDIDPEIGLRRSKAVASNRYEELDMEYHHRVRRDFGLQYRGSKDADGDHGDWILVDASKPLMSVKTFIFQEALRKVRAFGYLPEVN
jgi:dTMP kinase